MLGNLLETIVQTGFIGFFLGIAIVFLGIGVIVFVVWLVGKVLITSPSGKKKEKAVEPQPKPQPVPQVVSNDDIPDHVKVAIMAAIMAFYEQQNEKCEFTVRKIVRRR